MNKDNELKLVFITNKGAEYDKNNLYQLFFSLNPEDVVGDGWDCTPALGQPEIPEMRYIDAIYEIRTKLIFDRASDDGVFSMDDCVDGVVALAWENINDYEVYPSPRIVMRYGHPLEELQKLLGYDNLIPVPDFKKNEDDEEEDFY